MPGNTPKGYPYPLPTDPVSDLDLALKALAEKVEANVGLRKRGNAGVNTSSSGQFTIDHGLQGTPTYFDVRPDGSGQFHIGVIGMTATQVTCEVRRISDGAVYVGGIGVMWEGVR